MEGESTTEASVNRSPGRGLRNENCDDDEQRQYSFTYLVFLFLLFTARNIIFNL